MKKTRKLRYHKYSVAEIYAFLNSQDKYDKEDVKTILVDFTVYLESRKAREEIQSNFKEG